MSNTPFNSTTARLIGDFATELATFEEITPAAREALVIEAGRRLLAGDADLIVWNRRSAAA